MQHRAHNIIVVFAVGGDEPLRYSTVMFYP